MLDFARAYEERVKGLVIFPRANTPKARKILLHGAPKCGKTSLALDLVRHYKRAILVDCADLRLEVEEAQAELLKQVLEKRFDALIIDNYRPELTIPTHQDIIIVAPSPRHIPESIRTSFTTHCVRPLNFEEYVSCSKSNKLESIFASFLKEGNLPELPYILESKRPQRIQEIIMLYARENTDIFTFLLRYQGKPFSTHNAYCLLKQQQKISKDKIYALIQTLQDEQVIFTLPHATQRESKLYFYNFALPYALSSAPNFQSIFENMIFCELVHAGIRAYYDKSCDFIVDCALDSALESSMCEAMNGVAGDVANAITSNAQNRARNDTIGGVAIFALAFPTPMLIESKLAKLTRTFDEILFISIDTTLPPTKHARGNYRAISFIDFALEYLHLLKQHCV